MLFGAVFRRRSRALMAVVASLVGAATLFCLAAICLTVPQQMNEEMRSYGANLIVTSQTGLDDATVRAIEDEVNDVAEARAATYRYETVRINSAPYVLAGIDVSEVQALNRHWSVDGSWPSEGNVLVGTDVAEAMGLEVGSTITIGYRDDADTSASSDSDTDSVSGQMRDGRVSTDILETDGVDYRVAGILDTGGSEDEIVYAIASDVDAIAGERGPDVIEFSSSAGDEQLSTLVSALNGNTELGVSAQQVTKMTASNQRIIAMLQTLFWIVSLVVLVLTLVGVSTTMSSIVSQRRNEIGLRKALGASSGSVAAEFFVESALYGLIGGLVGMGLGYALARVLCENVFERTLAFNGLLGVASVLLSMLLAVIASVSPVRRATRIDPAVVLREE